MRFKIAFCLGLLTLPLLIGCQKEPKEEPTPPPPAGGAGPQTSAVAKPGGMSQPAAPQAGAKGAVPQ